MMKTNTTTLTSTLFHSTGLLLNFYYYWPAQASYIPNKESTDLA